MSAIIVAMVVVSRLQVEAGYGQTRRVGNAKVIQSWAMTNSSPTILIQGIGAMGGVVAARLLESGLNPALVTGSEEKAAAIRRCGLTLRAPHSQTHQKAAAFARVEDIPKGAAFDYVLILTKAQNLADAVRDALLCTHENTVFVAMQNGIVEPLVSEIAGAKRVIGSLLNWAATMHQPGDYEQTVAHSTVLGEFDGVITPRLRKLGQMLETVTPIRFSRNILGAQWAKLQMNCSVTALVTVCGTTLNDLLDSQAGRDVFVAVCREVLDVADMAGVRLDKLAVDPYTARSHSAGELDRWFEQIRATYGKSRPSLLEDLNRGRTTEVDFITGYVADTAQKHGATAPLCAAVTRMIHEAETQKRPLGMHNIDELHHL